MRFGSRLACLVADREVGIIWLDSRFKDYKIRYMLKLLSCHGIQVAFFATEILANTRGSRGF